MGAPELDRLPYVEKSTAQFSHQSWGNLLNIVLALLPSFIRSCSTILECHESLIFMTEYYEAGKVVSAEMICTTPTYQVDMRWQWQ